MTAIIERSTGFPTGFMGLRAGGGYEGATIELDDAVMQAAEALQAAYRRNIVIRFNSDRKSGGAWLRTHKKDVLGGNAELGICAKLWDIKDSRCYHTKLKRDGIVEQSFVEFCHERLLNPRGSRYQITFAAHIGTASLRDVAYATDRRNDLACAYAHRTVTDIPAALEFLKINGILRRRYSTREL